MKVSKYDQIFIFGWTMGEVPVFDKHFLDFPTGWRIRRLGRMNIFCPVIHSERIRETLTCAQLWSLFPPGLTRSINTAASDRLHMAQRHSAASPDRNLVTYRYIYVVIAYRFLRRPQQGQVGYHLTQPAGSGDDPHQIKDMPCHISLCWDDVFISLRHFQISSTWPGTL